MTPSMTAWPPTRISSSLELSAQDVAVIMRCFRYLKYKSISLGSGSLPVVFSLESFDTTGGVHQFLLAGEKGMAFRADFEVNLRLGRACLEGFATGALHDRIDVIRMDICFHQASSINGCVLGTHNPSRNL